MFPFNIFKRADIPENPVLGVLAYSAGIKQNKIGVLRGIGKVKTRTAEHSLDFFAVGNILLAAVGANKSQRLFAALADLHYFGNKIHIFKLLIAYGFRLNSISQQINTYSPILIN